MNDNRTSDAGELVQTIVLRISFMGQALLAGACVWIALSIEVSLPMLLIFWVPWASGIVFFFVNVALAIFGSKRRTTHVALAVSFIILLVFWLLSFDWHTKNRREWFVREGRKTYEELVQRVVQSGTLTDERLRLEGIIDDSSRIRGVVGRTNNDGSVTIWFAGRDGSGRRGYLYHSGELLTVEPAGYGYVCHLTNGWYDYGH